MFKIFSLLLLTLSCLNTKAQDNVEKKIRELEDIVVKGILQGDTNMLKQVWSPGFMVNTPRNDIAVNRDAVFQTQSAGLIDYSSFQRNIEQISVQENVVITMGYETFISKRDIPGAKAGAEVKRRFTNIWMNKNGQWQQIGRHASIICTN